MKILVGRRGGYCMGVRRAMEMALREAEQGESPVVTYGPLVHNPQALAMLAEKGISVCADLAGAARKGLRVVLRAHGIPPEARRRLVEAGAHLVDATCPKVARAQAVVRSHARRGRTVVIVGDPAHAEVVGLLGFAEGRGAVVPDEAAARAFPPCDGLAVVAQTTLRQSVFRSVARILAGKAEDCLVVDTICDATETRQAEMETLASRSDLVVVVGGRASANTAHLAEIARSRGVETLHVEGADELTAERFARVETVGVMAGASTPPEVLDGVIDRLRSFGGELVEDGVSS